MRMPKLGGLGYRLDRALSVVAPGWARNRIIARAQVQMLRTMEAAVPDRTSGRARRPAQGPRDKTKQDLETTRNQARDLYRHNPYARGVINSIVANLVGCGIRPQARVYLPKKATPDERFNDAAEEEWKRWADQADVTGKTSFYEQQVMLERERHVVGESLLVLGSPPSDDPRKVSLMTEVVPGERLSVKEEQRKDGSGIVQGVEFDAAGRILAYWVYPNHPWDGVYRSSEPVRVFADRVIHYCDQIEPGQVRGLTKLMTVAGAFEGFMQWLDWLLTKERVASAFALAILQNAGWLQSPLMSGSETEAEDTDEEEQLDHLEGGIIAHLKPGEDIKGIPSGVQASSVDLLSQVFLRVIARGLDVSYELVSRDLSHVTYLSARQGENQDRRHWEPQQEALNRSVNVPMWKQFVVAAAAGGLLPIRGVADRYLEVDFVRPGWPWIDPVKEVTADVAALQAGLASPMDLIIRRGGDPYKVLSDLETFKSWAKEKGLDLSIFQPAKPAAPVDQPSEEASDGEEKPGPKEVAA